MFYLHILDSWVLAEKLQDFVNVHAITSKTFAVDSAVVDEYLVGLARLVLGFLFQLPISAANKKNHYVNDELVI